MPTLKYKDPVTGEYKSDIHVVGAVSSVNGKTGVVELTNSDIPNAITDVQVNGASVVTDGVASIPIATATPGLVKSGGYGATVEPNSGTMYCAVLNVDTLNQQPQGYFMSRGTVNNVLAAPSAMPALTPAEQAAARERIGAERAKGSYALIESITVIENETSITKNVEPNGTNYNFSHAMVELNFPTGSYDTATVYTAYGADKRIACYTQVSSNDTYWKRASSWCDVEHGRLSMFTTAAALSYGGLDGSNDQVAVSCNPQMIIVNKNIEEITISTIRSTPSIPVGTVIRIYGVRA